MKKFARFLSFLSAFFGLWTLVRSPKGRAGGAVWIPKLWTGAWAPFLAMAGAVGALINLVHGDGAGTLAGLFGAWAGIRHTVRVTRRDADPFERAFGPDWEQRVASEQWTRLARPFELIQPSRRLGPFQKNIALDHAHLLADLWLPPADVPRSRLGVIFLHGGLWQAVDKDFLTRPLFERLVNQGHAVLDVAYSLAPTANIYQMLEEVKLAIAWMKTNASHLDIDPARVVLMGASGGAHLALLAAYTPNLPALQPKGLTTDTSVRGVVSTFGITDLVSFYYEYGEANPRQPEFSSQITEDMLPRLHNKTALDRFITRSRAFPAVRYSNMPGGALLLVKLMGGTLKEIPDVYHLFSPLAHVGAHCPPTLLIAAENDFVIDASHSRRLHRALQTLGVPSVYVEFPETVHGFDQYFGVSRRVAPAAQMATNDIEQFLALMV